MTPALVFDADDTLWENNVLFERAVERVIDRLTTADRSRAEVRDRLDGIERINTRRYGYGVAIFEHSLRECVQQLCGNVTEADDRVLQQACAPIRSGEVELIDGVAEALDQLRSRHSLYLLTKGAYEEQQAKVTASGLAGHFDGIGIVAEKDPPTYRAFLAEHGLTPEQTWMIGNSPSSDIRPALEAGMHAVLVPHPMTWSLEAAELPQDHPRFHTVAGLADLPAHFGDAPAL